MGRALKSVEKVDFSKWRGLVHGRCGSEIVYSGVEIPIGVTIQTCSRTVRDFYISGFGKTDTQEITLERYLDNGEIKRKVVNVSRSKYG